MFVNFSNHPSAAWGEEQLHAAQVFGEVKDIAFPNVSPAADEAEVEVLAQSCVEQIAALSPACVMCAGEFSLCFAVTKKLLAQGIKTVCACTERITEQTIEKSGEVKKISVFRFIKFREYR